MAALGQDGSTNTTVFESWVTDPFLTVDDLNPEKVPRMESRIRSITLVVLAICSIAATDRSRNFVVTAPTPEIAKQVARQAEICRHKLAVEWLGKPLPDWKYP